jgi:hypothetical protein
MTDIASRAREWLERYPDNALVRDLLAEVERLRADKASLLARTIQATKQIDVLLKGEIAAEQTIARLRAAIAELTAALEPHVESLRLLADELHGGSAQESGRSAAARAASHAISAALSKARQ